MRSRGFLTPPILLTIAGPLLLGLTALVYRGMASEIADTSEMVGTHETKIAVIENKIEPIPKIEKKVDQINDLVIQMAALQGIKAASTTP